MKTFNIGDPGVLGRMRRKLERSAALGECVLVDAEGAEELSPIQVHFLFAGLPPDKIRPIGFAALRPYPLPLNLTCQVGERKREGR